MYFSKFYDIFYCKIKKTLFFFDKLKNTPKKMSTQGSLGGDTQKHEIHKIKKNTRFHVFSIIFLKGFCSNTQKNKKYHLMYLSRWNSTFHKKFSVIISFAPYTRHLDTLFFRKNKCVALRNCLKKHFSFFIKSHHFHEVSPNRKQYTMSIVQNLGSLVFKTLLIWRRIRRNLCFHAF